MKKFISLLLITLLLCGMGFSVAASEHPVPDLTKKGSISVTMKDKSTVVGGGSLTLYRVGEVYDADGDFIFVPTGDFVESGAKLDDLESSSLATDLAIYAAQNDCASTTEQIDFNGVVTFDDLELGLYLLVQYEPAPNYLPVNPFLVSVPQTEDGAYIYDVDASPKVQLVFMEGDDDDGNPPPPDLPDEPDKPDEPKLPQTGQLNWPVPLLTVAGLGLFALGFMLCSGKKKERNEK